MTTSHVQDVTPRQAEAPVAVATNGTLTEDKPPALKRPSGGGIAGREVATRVGVHRAKKTTAAVGGAAIGMLLGVLLGVLVAGPGWLAVVATTTLVGSLWGTAIGSLPSGRTSHTATTPPSWTQATPETTPGCLAGARPTRGS